MQAASLSGDRRRGFVLAAGLAAALLLLVLPEAANAAVLPRTPTAVFGLDPVGFVKDVIRGILKIFFSPIASLTRNMLTALIACPNYADAGRFGRLNEMREYIASGAWGLLTLVFVGSSLRYWAAGFTSASSGEAVASLGRSVVAVALLVGYPVLFADAITFTNLLSKAIMDGPAVQDGLTDVFVDTADPTVAGGPFMGGFLGIFVMAAMGIAMIGLLIVKIVLTVTLAVLFISAPLVIVLWPLGDLAWLVTFWFKSLLIVCVYPVVWALCFATYALVGSSTFAESGPLGGAAPLFGIAALVTAFKVPQLLSRQAIGGSMTPRVMQSVSRAGMMAYGGARLGSWAMGQLGGGAPAAAATGRELALRGPVSPMRPPGAGGSSSGPQVPNPPQGPAPPSNQPPALAGPQRETIQLRPPTVNGTAVEAPRELNRGAPPPRELPRTTSRPSRGS